MTSQCSDCDSSHAVHPARWLRDGELVLDPQLRASTTFMNRTYVFRSRYVVVYQCVFVVFLAAIVGGTYGGSKRPERVREADRTITGAL